MEFTPPRAALTLWRVYSCAVSALALVLCVFLSLILPPPVSAALFSLVILSGAFLCFFYLPKLRENSRVILSSEAIMYTTGVFIRRKYLFPLPRMIYTEQFKTPVSSAMNLCNIRLRAARSRLTVFSLSSADAQKILDATGSGGELS